MKSTRLARAERHLMAAEYNLDSMNTHVRRKGCDDVKPLALARYTKALNKVRAALALIRNEQGARHPTLFAGAAPNPGEPGKSRSQKQKPWGSHTPHGWKKDCENRRGPPPDFAGFDARFQSMRGRRR